MCQLIQNNKERSSSLYASGSRKKVSFSAVFACENLEVSDIFINTHALGADLFSCKKNLKFQRAIEKFFSAFSSAHIFFQTLLSISYTFFYLGIREGNVISSRNPAWYVRIPVGCGLFLCTSIKKNRL